VHRSRCIVALVAIAYVAPGTSSVAWAERRIAVVSAGTCPSREAVVSALTRAMPDATIVDGAVDAPSDVEPVVVVSDGGASYRAVIRGVVRTLVDPPANCEERARKVAIVAALALEPAPLIAPRPASEPVQTVAMAVRVPSSRVGVRFETGGVVESGRAEGVDLQPIGGTARLTIERDHFGLVIGGTLVGWTAVGSRFVQRIPIDAALQLRGRSSWLAGALEFGPRLVFQRSHDMDGRFREVPLEADFRLSGRVELWAPGRAYGGFAAVTGTYVPNPAPLREIPFVEDAPTMPTWWIGASAGLVFEIR
jgi:hypothetical protein